MTNYAVRGYWLSGAVRFMKVHYPADTNERLLASLPKGVRASFALLEPMQWCPRSHHVELLRAIASVRTDEALAREDLMAYGQYLGNEMANGSLRSFLLIARLKLFARKLPELWARDHQDDAKLESDIAQLQEESRLPLRLSGIEGYDHVGIVTLGWVKGMLAGLGRRVVDVKQSGWSLKLPAPSEMTGEVRWA
ncbi:MAG TPA: hypothetical protein VNW92_30850 [Polyangiaceae bacterium]|jgi:hypothetical protein|nr:hypothetical protein [Polyangiaceae bacterium]